MSAMSVVANNILFSGGITPANPWREWQYTITRVFKKLRLAKYGKFVAKQNFLCCGSCAWAELGDKFPDCENIVFYHNQCYESLKETGSVYLQWAGDGDAIKNAFIKMDECDVIWDGDSGTCIKLQFKNRMKDVAKMNYALMLEELKKNELN